jgi:hypothetical protein
MDIQTSIYIAINNIEKAINGLDMDNMKTIKELQLIQNKLIKIIRQGQ